ncbi:MAG: hypothetical protein LUC17_04705 [Oscillospiraceae bacterium]|nr:hypothetical protein [Oscillospiraceae bacterium]
MKCANCGNEDPALFCEEENTIFCVKCCHRTLKDSGESDLVVCPNCGELKDRMAYYCRWCGASCREKKNSEDPKALRTRIKHLLSGGSRA